MNLRFLPVGSVCLVGNLDRKMMVIGYKRSGYDYVAVEFPKGYETEDDIQFFNHDDIVELYSYGYKNDESRVFTNSLEDTPMYNVEESIDVNMGYVFNDNGIVVADKPVVTTPVTDYELVEENNEEVEHNFNDETNFVEETQVSEEQPKYQFDENGVVVGEPQTSEEQPKYQFDENGVVVGETQVSEEQPKYQFDENGVVVGETQVSEEQPKYQFDENGVVVEETQVSEEQPKYQFDENGVVVGEPQTPKEQPKYRFDENGVVVEDLTSTLEQPTTQLEEEVVEEKVVDTGSITLVDPFSTAEEEPTINFNEDGTVAVDEDTQSIFGEIEAPGTIDEPKEEMTFDEKIEEETSNFDIPEETVSSVPAEDQAMATFDTASEQPQEEQPVEEPKKEEKKKRGFFNFGR